MKRLILALAFVLVTATSAMSDVVAEWTVYTPPTPGPAVTGFNLYKNDVKVESFVGANLIRGVSKTPIVKGDSFTLTAYFTDGSESPQSEPFVINWHGNPPNLHRMRFTR